MSLADGQAPPEVTNPAASPPNGSSLPSMVLGDVSAVKNESVNNGIAAPSNSQPVCPPLKRVPLLLSFELDTTGSCACSPKIVSISYDYIFYFVHYFGRNYGVRWVCVVC